MSKRIFDKAPLTFQEQLALLQNRGLIIEDGPKALSYLKEISYYRLSAYFLPYQYKKNRFNRSTTFRQIIDAYTFDRELRLLIFDCIERIEIAIRTQIIYSMAIHYQDSHWQDTQAYFIKPYYNKIGIQVDLIPISSLLSQKQKQPEGLKYLSNITRITTTPRPTRLLGCAWNCSRWENYPICSGA